MFPGSKNPVRPAEKIMPQQAASGEEGRGKTDKPILSFTKQVRIVESIENKCDEK
jgi:hypothetical protein